MDEDFRAKIKEAMLKKVEPNKVTKKVYDIFSSSFKSILDFRLEDNDVLFDIKIASVISKVTMANMSNLILCPQSESHPDYELMVNNEIEGDFAQFQSKYCYSLPTLLKDLIEFKPRDIGEFYSMWMTGRPRSKLSNLHQMAYTYMDNTGLEAFLRQEVVVMSNLHFSLEYLHHFNKLYYKNIDDKKTADNQSIIKLLKYAYPKILKYSEIVCHHYSLSSFLKVSGPNPKDRSHSLYTKDEYLYTLNLYSYQLSEYLRKLGHIKFYLSNYEYLTDLKKFDIGAFENIIKCTENSTFYIFANREAENIFLLYSKHKSWDETSSSFSYVFSRLKAEGKLNPKVTNQKLFEWIWDVYEIKLTKLRPFNSIKNGRWQAMYEECQQIIETNVVTSGINEFILWENQLKFFRSYYANN